MEVNSECLKAASQNRPLVDQWVAARRRSSPDCVQPSSTVPATSNTDTALTVQQRWQGYMVGMKKPGHEATTIRYDTIGEFNVDWKAECGHLNLAQVTKIKKYNITRRN